jgi:hypothetical protein
MHWVSLVSVKIDSMSSNVSTKRTARYSFVAPLRGVKFGFIYRVRNYWIASWCKALSFPLKDCSNYFNLRTVILNIYLFNRLPDPRDAISQP